MTDTAPIVIWADANQRDLITGAVAEAGVEVKAVGAATHDAAAELAGAIGAEPFDDLRQTFQTPDVRTVWVASGQPLAADLRRLLREAGVTALCSEPTPGTVAELSTDPEESRATVFVPLMRRGEAMSAAREVLDGFGEIQCLTVAMRSRSGEGSLFARMFDAMDLFHWLLDDAQTLHGVLASREAAVPEALPQLSGHLALTLRLTDRRCGSMTLSDRGGSWFRGLTILGEAGCLRITDAGFEWIDANGAMVDSHRVEGAVTPSALVGRAIRRAIDQADVGEPPPDWADVLALCEAARLSCRTGQSEAPRKILEMARRP